MAVSDNNARPLVARLRLLEEGPINAVGAMEGGAPGGNGAKAWRAVPALRRPVDGLARPVWPLSRSARE